MALIGGAGNPVGGTFTGPAQGLDLVGDHAYAYSGEFGTSTTEFDMLTFTTGNYYTVGTFTCNGAVRMNLVDVGSISGYQLKLNGTGVLRVKVDTNDKDSPGQSFMQVIIPAFTQVVLSCNCTENTDNEKVTASYAGRVYRQ
mgnify:CR=1 FL=1